jgi:hypothetical protein
LSAPMPIQELRTPSDAFVEAVDKLPDNNRARLIQMAGRVARLAVMVDKPRHELKGLLEHHIETMQRCLGEWTEEDQF